MIRLKSLAEPPDAALRNIGWNWMLGEDTLPYVVRDVVSLSEAVAGNFYEAAETLYPMFVEAGQHVIDKYLFREMGIPENLAELIRYTWEDDRHVHLYGRFDLAGDLDKAGSVKLIEFNADTATCIPETAVVQWAHLQRNGLSEAGQFNTLYESLVTQFRYLKEVNADLTPSILLSAMRGCPEDDANVAVLAEAAREAGFDTGVAYIDQVDFSESEGVYMQDPDDGSYVRFDFWFKLVPWEYIAADEPELCGILTRLVLSRKVVVLNPAYTLLFQSKYILKVLWDLYPYHPLLLQTERYPIPHKKSVAKVLLGREGANVSIIERGGEVTDSVDGAYSGQPKIYQEYMAFPVDEAGNAYQAGVFYAGAPCGLGFRRGGKILDNMAQFAGHFIE